MSRRALITLAALVILLYGLGFLTYTINETGFLGASLSTQKRGERQKKRGGWLAPMRSSTASSTICAAHEECTTMGKAPPCGSPQRTCSKSRRGKQCGKSGSEISYCYSCPAPTWVDSSHHNCP